MRGRGASAAEEVGGGEGAWFGSGGVDGGGFDGGTASISGGGSGALGGRERRSSNENGLAHAARWWSSSQRCKGALASTQNVGIAVPFSVSLMSVQSTTKLPIRKILLDSLSEMGKYLVAIGGRIAFDVG